MIAVVIRPETPSDAAAIRHLTDLAFTGKEQTKSYEAAVVDGLRTANALTVSLVATTSTDSTGRATGTGSLDIKSNSRVLGHVAFSPVTIDGQERGYYGLGPISVHPSSRHQGIGSSLIREGMDRVRGLGAKGVVLLGNPAFYTRFGFKQSDRLWFADAPKENFMVYQFDQGDETSGEVKYHEAFSVTR